MLLNLPAGTKLCNLQDLTLKKNYSFLTQTNLKLEHELESMRLILSGSWFRKFMSQGFRFKNFGFMDTNLQILGQPLKNPHQLFETYCCLRKWKKFALQRTNMGSITLAQLFLEPIVLILI